MGKMDKMERMARANISEKNKKKNPNNNFHYCCNLLIKEKESKTTKMKENRIDISLFDLFFIHHQLYIYKW